MKITAECVTPRHPDKLCDQIADAILDEAVGQDPDSRVAVEVLGGHGVIIVMGEVTTKAYVNVPAVVERIMGAKYPVLNYIVSQSPEIAHGVDTGGAGDQGIMIGYATDETPEFMPKEVMYARELCQFLYGLFPYDGKTQVTLENGEIKKIVTSFQHVKSSDLKNAVLQWLEVLDSNGEVEILANPAGDWKTGGFEADTGLTGRKLLIDAYGPRVPIGGGSFSGKDATKVDRSGAYIARKIAVELLKEHTAKEVIVRLSYAIGVADPVQAVALIDGKEVDISNGTYGLPLKPNEIIEALHLKEPQFEQTAKWGHFGNGFKWDGAE